MAALLAGALWTLATPASAQQRLVLEPDTTGGYNVGCDTLDGCADGFCEGDLVCGSIFGEQRCLFSLEGETELICCDGQSTGACPLQQGTEGVCTPVGETGTSICVYPELFTFCVDAGTTLTLDHASKCLQAVEADGLTLDWKKGDCDADGVANGLDCFPCDPQRHDCPVVDAGVPDASVPEPDANIIDEIDAGSRDETDGVSFQGDGGCDCRVADGQDLTGGAVPAALLLGGLLGWRRRRR